MANFNRDYQSNNNRNFGKPRFNNRRQDMHKATCSNCGRICEVPFKPTGSKPVFCKECFSNNGGSEARRSEDRSFERTNSEDRQMYDAVCAKCGNNCKVPFRPSPDRDVLCSACFGVNKSSDARRPERGSFDKPNFKHEDSRVKTDTPNYKAQFEALNAKMDKILSLLAPTPTAVVPLESVIDEKVIEEIAEEVQEDTTKTAKKKQKEANKLTVKPTTKTKKTTAPKKK